MNIIMTGGAVLATMGIGVIVTYPDVPTWPLIAIVGSVAILVGKPPTSYTVWLAVDVRMHPLEPEELADAAAHANSQTQAQ